jgi:hypothetical protein
MPMLVEIILFIKELIDLAGDMFATILSTPASYTYNLPGLREMWMLFSALANLLLVTFLMIGGIQVMMGRMTGRAASITPQELISRFFMQALALNSSFFLAQTFIDIENALCSGVLAYTLGVMRGQITQNAGNVLVFILQFFVTSLLTDGLPLAIAGIFGILCIVMLFLLFFQAIGRLLRLNLLLMLLPLAFLFLTLEQTKEYGMLLVRMFVVTLFTQLLQVAALCLLLLLFTFLIAGPSGHGLFAFFMLIGQLFAVYSIPGILTRFGIQGGSAGGVIRGAIQVARLAIAFA